MMDAPSAPPGPPAPATTPAPAETPAAAATPPILMVGAARSGTTMLRVMLDHHPLINAYGELEYATLGVQGDTFPDVATYHEMLADDRVYLMGGFPIDASLSHRDLVRSFLDAARRREPGKPHVAVTIHHHLHLLPDLWPEARYIHVLRDPRDVARSTMRLGWTGHPYFGVDIWLDARRQFQRLTERVDPGRILTVRYADLVRDAEGELRRCCAHLGVGYDPAMLEYDRSSTYEKPDPSLVDQWKRKMSERDVRLIEGRCGALLHEAGYEGCGKEPIKPGPAERARLRLLNKWGKVRFQQRRYGTGLWLRRAAARRGGPSKWRRRVLAEAYAVHNRQLQ